MLSPSVISSYHSNYVLSFDQYHEIVPITIVNRNIQFYKQKASIQDTNTLKFQHQAHQIHQTHQAHQVHQIHQKLQSFKINRK